ncbi:MAG: hypothetical protein LUE29_10015 [Lachnospiraceae bacterium]|nr:hypothetical protein [Lachnospiraceae bacterium]
MADMGKNFRICHFIFYYPSCAGKTMKNAVKYKNALDDRQRKICYNN